MKTALKPAIILFVYARLHHTMRTVEALINNHGAIDHDLIVYSDAARGVHDAHLVESVRKYIGKISGFKRVILRFRESNYGLSHSIISGVSEALLDYEEVIVLEDDLVTSPYFLQYMTNGLCMYKNQNKVVSIHGYMYPVKSQLPEVFFLRGADCWGWATWRRGWAMFNVDGQYLLDELRKKKLTHQFDFQGVYKYTQMLEDQINGKNDSWAIRWHASAFLANKLTLYPGRSLVNNIGNDSSGTHCGTTTELDVELSTRPVCLQNVIVEESVVATKAVQDFFQSKRTSLQRIILPLIPHAINRKLIDFIKNSLPSAMVAWLRRF